MPINNDMTMNAVSSPAIPSATTPQQSSAQALQISSGSSALTAPEGQATAVAHIASGGDGQATDGAAAAQPTPAHTTDLAVTPQKVHESFESAALKSLPLSSLEKIFAERGVLDLDTLRTLDNVLSGKSVAIDPSSPLNVERLEQWLRLALDNPKLAADLAARIPVMGAREIAEMFRVLENVGISMFTGGKLEEMSPDKFFLNTELGTNLNANIERGELLRLLSTKAFAEAPAKLLDLIGMIKTSETGGGVKLLPEEAKNVVNNILNKLPEQIFGKPELLHDVKVLTQKDGNATTATQRAVSLPTPLPTNNFSPAQTLSGSNGVMSAPTQNTFPNNTSNVPNNSATLPTRNAPNMPVADSSASQTRNASVPDNTTTPIRIAPTTDSSVSQVRSVQAPDNITTPVRIAPSADNTVSQLRDTPTIKNTVTTTPIRNAPTVDNSVSQIRSVSTNDNATMAPIRNVPIADDQASQIRNAPTSNNTAATTPIRNMPTANNHVSETRYVPTNNNSTPTATSSPTPRSAVSLTRGNESFSAARNVYERVVSEPKFNINTESRDAVSSRLSAVREAAERISINDNRRSDVPSAPVSRTANIINANDKFAASQYISGNNNTDNVRTHDVSPQISSNRDPVDRADNVTVYTTSTDKSYKTIVAGSDRNTMAAHVGVSGSRVGIGDNREQIRHTAPPPPADVPKHDKMNLVSRILAQTEKIHTGLQNAFSSIDPKNYASPFDTPDARTGVTDADTVKHNFDSMRAGILLDVSMALRDVFSSIDGLRETIELFSSESARLLTDAEKALIRAAEALMRQARQVGTELTEKLGDILRELYRAQTEAMRSDGRTMPTRTPAEIMRSAALTAAGGLESLHMLAAQTRAGENVQQQVFALPVKMGQEWTEVQIKFIKKDGGKKDGNGEGNGNGHVSVFLDVTPSALGHVSAHLDFHPPADLKLSFQFEKPAVTRWFKERSGALRETLANAGLPGAALEFHTKRATRKIISRNVEDVGVQNVATGVRNKDGKVDFRA